MEIIGSVLALIYLSELASRRWTVDELVFSPANKIFTTILSVLGISTMTDFIELWAIVAGAIYVSLMVVLTFKKLLVRPDDDEE